ncbi:MAG: CAP domain-containing protein [Pseudomonadota bacterium]
MRVTIKILVVVVLSAVVAGCGIPRLGFGDKPRATVPNVPRERSVNPERAVALINAHRADKGRPPLTHDPRLSKIARETAQELARRNTVRTEMHTAAGMGKRLDAANYVAVRAAENLAGGHPTLVLTVEGWKDSRRHNRNLLNRDFTHAGMGLALTSEGQLKSFWVLILATPEEAA